MRVKVGDKWFAPEVGQPVMVVLNSGEREQIANMHPDATKYAQFDDAEEMTNDEKFAWMSEGDAVKLIDRLVGAK